MAMRPFFVCDRHSVPMRFQSQEMYEDHMKKAHRERYFEMLQVRMDIEALKRKDIDPYEEYYGKQESVK